MSPSVGVGVGLQGTPDKAQAQTLLRLWGQSMAGERGPPAAAPPALPHGAECLWSHCRRAKVSGVGVKVQLAQPHGLAGRGLVSSG